MESKVFSTDDSTMDLHGTADQVQPVNPDRLASAVAASQLHTVNFQIIIASYIQFEVVACIYCHGVVVNLDLCE